MIEGTLLFYNEFYENTNNFVTIATQYNNKMYGNKNRKMLKITDSMMLLQAAEQARMDPSMALKKGKKRKAPRPPNPFTGQVETEEDEVNENIPFNNEETDPSEVGGH